MVVPDFSKIWASQSPLTPYEFSDEDYLDGWEFIGEIPPDRRMLDTWQRQADTKMQWLKNNMLGYLLRQNSTQYEAGDVAFSASLPSNLVLECTMEGTTAAIEPDFSGAVEGGTVTDGGVVWTYKSLVGGLDREQIPAFNHREVITTSGTYTAPVTGWYLITAKGGGGGGGGGSLSSSYSISGGGGGEGGTAIAYEYMNAGDTATVVIGAGGTGGTGINHGTAGGDSSVTVNSNTYTGGGGSGGHGGTSGAMNGGHGGSGDIAGAAGISGNVFTTAYAVPGGSGGGNGGGVSARAAGGGAGTLGGGGAGGGGDTGGTTGGAGGNGFVWFEYFEEV